MASVKSTILFTAEDASWPSPLSNCAVSEYALMPGGLAGLEDISE